jgi:outer membrane protein assembly factor BamB
MVRTTTGQRDRCGETWGSCSPAAFRRDRTSLWGCVKLLVVCCFVQLWCTPAATLRADNWPRFRGPNGAGTSDLKGVPTRWTDDDYEWEITLPGIGHSSPVVWDDALFVTSGTDRTAEPDSVVGSRTLYRINAITGDVVWSREFKLASDVLHPKNSYASSTPALDGERVYLAMADDEHYVLQALTMQGETVWSAELGPFESQHGQGVSPIVYDGMVILANDQIGPSSIAAFNCGTGERIWEVTRNDGRTSYATPCIMPVAGYGPQILCLSDTSGLAGLDPRTGRQLWATEALPDRTVASPTFGNGLIIATCGGGGIGKHLLAVVPPGPAAVAPTIRYQREQRDDLPYVPTPIINGAHVYLWCDRATVCCVELATGNTVWRKRVEGNYSGSPIMIDQKLYCISEEGEIAVLSASPEFRDYGRSPLGDGSHATPAVANGRVYFRGFGRLACLPSAEVKAGTPDHHGAKVE